MAVGDARAELEQFDKATVIFKRAYYACNAKQGKCEPTPNSYPIAHKMIRSGIKAGGSQLEMAEVLGSQILMLSMSMPPGSVPDYITQDYQDARAALYGSSANIGAIPGARAAGGGGGGGKKKGKGGKKGRGKR